MIDKQILLTFLNEPELFFVHTVKWFQLLLFKSQFNISHLFGHIVFLFEP